MIDYSRFKFGKPGPKPRSTTAKRRHRREKTAKRVRQRDVIAETRTLVFALDRVCPVCLRPGRETDEMHEVVPRSKTRGKPPEERFNRRICARLHSGCHKKVTANEIRLIFLDATTGVDGGLLVYSGDSLKHIYRRP